MPESDELDPVLRRALTGRASPTLSPEFEARLTTRLKPRRLSQRSRSLLTGYSVAGLAVSVLAMGASGLPWWLIGVLILVPAGTVAVLIRPFLR